MAYHNTEQAQVLEPGTLKNYFTTQKYLKEFIQERFNTTDKYLSELTYKFITDFEYFLRIRKPEKGQKKLENNGLMKHLERFCKMVNLAVRLEWLDRNPFQAYQLKFDRVEREYLTKVYVMEMLTTLFRAKLTTGLADFWVAANAIKACTKIVI